MKGQTLFLALCFLTVIVAGLDVAKVQGYLVPEIPAIKVVGDKVYLPSLTLEQKIAQMVIAIGDKRFIDDWKKLKVGGVHMYTFEDEEEYVERISSLQDGMDVPFFITADLEGCVSPFPHIREFKTFADISSQGEAYELGFEQGKYLSELGFNFDFSPVVDLEDNIWGCRSFIGDEDTVSKYAEAYMAGLNSQGILTTAKHYPGKTLVGNDPHLEIAAATIDKKDLYPYNYLGDKPDAIMVSHIITSGEIDSEGIPSVMNQKVISNLKKNFNGLVITDEIHMLGLKKYYSDIDEMYLTPFLAGHDMVLNFDNDINEMYRFIKFIESKVNDGTIPRSQIDSSVTKILEKKGFKVVN